MTTFEQSASPSDHIRVSVIDVGKGDCILIRVGELAALIDTGYEKTSDKVVSYLREQGIDRLEFLVITHYDRDHVGGTRAIGGTFSIGTVFLPAYEGADKNYRTLTKAISDLGLNTQRVHEELPLQLADARFTLIPSSVEFVPDAKGNEGNDNDLSLVATLVYGNNSYLFTGDLEEDGIAAYLNNRRGQFDVLKVPCHGEKCSNTAALLDDVRPRLAIVTDSADDPASKKTLKLLNEIGATTYTTNDCGTVVIESNGTSSYTVSPA